MDLFVSAFRSVAPAPGASKRQLQLLVCIALVLSSAGCDVEPPTGTGPGRRPQALALTPEEELALGRQAFAELKSRYRPLRSGEEVERVRRVGRRIVKAAEIEPLQREINLRVKDYIFEWEFEVLASDHINAVCLPAGKIAVFTGLLRQLKPSDDQLAAVMAHEVAHALAHHASERLARHNRLRTAADEALVGSLTDETMDLLVPGLSGLAHNRAQESEADHIGVFLMTFAEYDPQEAVAFWERMSRLTAARGQMPEILSDHPSDARRIAQLKEWVPMARGAKRAYDAGHIAPP